MLALWFEKHKDYIQSSNILYFSFENSLKLWFERNNTKCLTANISAGADLILDIQATGLPEESYDLIICNHVLEHVNDFRIALKEAYRILRKGGSFLCSFPMDPKIDLIDEDNNINTDEERYNRFGQKDHKRLFGMNSDIFLAEAGFSVEKILGDQFPNEILPVIGPADYDMNCLFRCIK